MLIQKQNANKKELTKESSVYEYDFGTKNFGLATAKLNGRLPEKGWMRNKECAEIYYVVSGSGVVFIEDERFELGEGDAILIAKNKKYYVEANNLNLVIPTCPAWDASQHEIVDD